MAATVAKDQQEPQEPWAFTDETPPANRQSNDPVSLTTISSFRVSETEIYSFSEVKELASGDYINSSLPK